MDAIDELGGAHGNPRPLEVLAPPLALPGELNLVLSSTLGTLEAQKPAWLLVVRGYFLNWYRLLWRM
jgi:hypothetical protein